jgi:hypothetical protein
MLIFGLVIAAIVVGVAICCLGGTGAHSEE